MGIRKERNEGDRYMFTQKIRGYVVLKAFRDILKENHKVLDIGCGNGIITKMIEDRFNCNIIGTDVLSYSKGIRFKQIEHPYKLPFKEKEFDYSLFIDTLHHITTQKQSIREALRVANKTLIYDIEPGFGLWFTDNILNRITNKKMEVGFTQRTIEGWKEFFDKINVSYKLIKFNKHLWYPLPQFAFEIENK